MPLVSNLIDFIDTVSVRLDSFFSFVRQSFGYSETPKARIGDLTGEEKTPALFVRAVYLPPMGEVSARRAIELQLPRLSPLPESDIYWSLSLPNEEGERNLALIKRADLHRDSANNGKAMWAYNIADQTGRAFTFRTPDQKRARGRHALSLLCGSLLAYMLALWGISQWTDRFLRQHDLWQQDARVLTAKQEALQGQSQINESLISALSLAALRQDQQHLSDIFAAIDLMIAENPQTKLSSFLWQDESVILSVMGWSGDTSPQLVLQGWDVQTRRQNVNARRDDQDFQMRLVRPNAPLGSE